MQAIIREVNVQVIPMNTQCVVFMNGQTKPYSMAWNPKKYCWGFAMPQDMPQQWQEIENEISNFIIKSEKAAGYMA